MSRINLSSIPELEGLSILINQEEFEEFTAKLRQDYYSPAKIKELGLEQEFDNWLESRKSGLVTFFAVKDEEDTTENDHWGHYELLRCAVVRSPDGKLHLLKSLIKRFNH